VDPQPSLWFCRPHSRARDLIVACSWGSRPRLYADASFASSALSVFHVAPGYQRVMPQNAYSRDAGYGFEPGAQITCVNRNSNDALRGDFCTSDEPFYFSVALPEGNYNVTVTLGDADGESVTTIKAELRRLMLEKVETRRGKFESRTFTVNVRTPQITGAGEVRLKDREKTI